MYQSQFTQASILYVRKKLLYWGRDNFSRFPWRYESNRFHALIAEILLQRTRAETVSVVYYNFKERFPNAEALGQATVTDIEKVIGSLGLNWRARILLELGKKLTEIDEQIPENKELLLKLPGVGPYVASAFLSFHAGVRASIIDSNVVRFYGRFFGFSTGTETRREEFILNLADLITPKKIHKNFNYALIDFCRIVCKPQSQHLCCPISHRCAYISNIEQV